ncbi:hypothetical protein [Pseudomonas sp. 910_21]|uniref:hypothetical protein n=1 Tax=Pseudomonas sp. 910_21 TaxID=2604460 RepID=UPI004062A435
MQAMDIVFLGQDRDVFGCLKSLFFQASQGVFIVLLGLIISEGLQGRNINFNIPAVKKFNSRERAEPWPNSVCRH